MSEEFSEVSFWEKIKKFSKKAGKEVIEKSLCLYFAAQREETPVWAKTAIYGALAYFVMPIDAIPDIAPLVGYTDDLAVLGGALVTVAKFIDDNVKAEAEAKMTTWFG